MPVNRYTARLLVGDAGIIIAPFGPSVSIYLYMGAGLLTSMSAERPLTQPPSLLRSSGLFRREASPLPVNRWDSLLLTSIRMRKFGWLRNRNAPLAGTTPDAVASWPLPVPDPA